MKFKFSVTVTDNEILQVIIKQSLLTRNWFNYNVCICINFHSKFNNTITNLLYENDFNNEKEFMKVLILISYLTPTRFNYLTKSQDLLGVDQLAKSTFHSRFAQDQWTQSYLPSEMRSPPADKNDVRERSRSRYFMRY